MKKGIFICCGLERDELRRTHSVTGSDETGEINLDAITDVQRDALLDAILSDESLDQWMTPDNDNNNEILLSSFAAQHT